jgi:hypothetical protein
MEINQFDTLTRSLTVAGSRRRVLALAFGGLISLGLARSDDVAAGGKCKPKCPECRKCKKGKNGKAGKCTGKKPNGAACPDGICQSGRCVAAVPPVCPPVCPVCQTCNAATGQCGVQSSQNGQAGQSCAGTKVCCSGTCCDPIHECNDAGVCATCAEVCGASCLCLTLADGGMTCSGLFSTCTPGETCSSTADCPDLKVCVTSVTNPNTNVTFQGCGVPVGSGVCWPNSAC